MKDKIEETIAGLKDFQLKTVDYVFEQLYVNHRNKMLIADEVGLGKTIVAKGIIAKAFENFMPTKKKPVFNVIYICSNQALARQNLKKLNFTGNKIAVDYSKEDDRLSGLAYVPNIEDEKFPFRIKAFTPATSFNDRTHAGRADERVLLYRLLYRYSDLNPYKKSLKWIFKGNQRIRNKNWMARIKYAEQFDQGKDIYWLRKIRPQVFSEFRNALNEKVQPSDLPKSFKALGITYEIKYWTLLRNLCKLGINHQNFSKHSFIKELISSLRFKLSRVCLDFLQADIFILDEFQRYKQLIDSVSIEDLTENKISPAIQIARDIFSFDGSKILMLSATPFKPYTNDFDELNGEVHYSEFKMVLQFLMNDKSEEFWKQYEDDRRSFFYFLRHPDDLLDKMPEAQLLKEKLESLYRTAIVRTEKLLVSKNRDALIKHVHKEPLALQTEDIRDFVILDRITQILNKEYKASLQVPLEYVKSSPFPLSFLNKYQHKEKIRTLAFTDDKLRRLLFKTKHGWLNLDNINHYKPLIPLRGKQLPNAKLRLLLDETVLNGGWKYLWIPPSVPYYTSSGAFKNSLGYSKTLIFSSWKLVPRMVASLVSYEAERLSIGNPNSISEKEKIEDKRLYFQKRRTPRPQFTFKVDKDQQEPQQMKNFILSYPSLYLTKIYDPAINVVKDIKFRQIKKELKEKLINDFKRLDLNRFVSGQGDWQKWYWLAPILFDKATDERKEISNWFEKGMPPSELSIDTENEKTDKEEKTGKSKHFALARSVFRSDSSISAPKLNKQQINKLCGHLAELSIASPAICFLRSHLRYSDLSLDTLDAAYNVASAFYTMFNKPESIAVVRLTTTHGDYWQRALKYMIDGNIQAMLDEFLYLLINGENIHSVTELSDFISDILSVRTAVTDTEDYDTFMENLKREKENKKIKKRPIRSHYAADFGTQQVSTAKGAGRQINIRQAFNSPFRPFVLASTSVGQEGLDFHFYCKKIFHWNLPSNPIDFEQREGRIHRYQGLVIRLNLADKYKKIIQFKDDRNNVWTQIFQVALKEKSQAQFQCDLVPFWHTESNNDIKIERFVPLYPYSKDIEKFNDLIKVLTFYRLTFGQPRQDELVEALNEYGFSDELIKKVDDMIINLSPIKFN